MICFVRHEPLQDVCSSEASFVACSEHEAKEGRRQHRHKVFVRACCTIVGWLSWLSLLDVF
jgi:hypothetical protein